MNERLTVTKALIHNVMAIQKEHTFQSDFFDVIFFETLFHVTYSRNRKE